MKSLLDYIFWKIIKFELMAYFLRSEDMYLY